MSAQSDTQNVKVGVEQGGNRGFVKSGGEFDVESGGALKIAGTDKTAVLAAAVAAPVAGVAAGYKIARGQHTTVDADDTVVTGLATVVSVVAQFDSDPVVGANAVVATIGDQAGAPAAGSIQIKTFKPTAVGDATPTAATTFSLKVNWIAIGT